MSDLATKIKFMFDILQPDVDPGATVPGPHHDPSLAGRNAAAMPGPVPDPGPPGPVPLERLEAQICELAGHLAAATCRFLVLLGDFDARRGWASWEMNSCAEWLSWKCQMGSGTAREHVRVARALRDLPVIRAEFGAGRLSYAKAAQGYWLGRDEGTHHRSFSTRRRVRPPAAGTKRGPATSRRALIRCGFRGRHAARR